MKVRNHRLIGGDGSAVPLKQTPNRSDKLVGGAPKYLVIHYTAAGAASGSIRHLTSKAARASAHLVIGRDGDVTQLGRFDEKLWHAGTSRWKGILGLNGHSVGIELANWGKLSGGSGGWKTWTGGAVDDDLVVAAAHKNAPDVIRGWEIYPEAQVRACADAARAICEAYGLRPADIIGHDDISPGRKSDPGPAWDMERFRSLVFGRADDGDAAGPEDEPRWQVRSASGLNLRDGPGTENGIIKLLDDGTEVAVVEQPGTWWMVAEVVDGVERDTGWVHSRWLQPA
ncbi:MAG: N-acetylmuramoyl-L-alanine amidase [Pseudomonadota bacterium]